MMPAPKKSAPPSISAVSRETGVARQTLRLWRDTEGLDIGDLAAVRARARLKRPATTSPPPSLDTGETYSAARRRREIALADRAEIIAKREAGQLVDLAEVQQAFAAIGSELRARLLAWRGSLVTELEGRPAEQIHRVLDQHVRELLGALHKNTKIPIP